MHIVQIGPYPLSAECIRGGVEASVYGLSQELAKSHTIEVFDIPRLNGRNILESYPNLTIHRYCNYGKHNKDAIRVLPTIIQDIVALRPDVCHIHGTSLFSRAVYIALQKSGISTMLTVHGLLKVEKQNTLRKKFSLKGLYQYLVQTYSEKSLLSICPRIIVDTEYVAQAITAYQLKNEPQMHVVPQGIDEHYYDLQCDKDSKIILSVGSISKRKGHLLLIKAFEQVCLMGLDVQLKIVGFVAENEYYQEIKTYISQSPFQNRISLMTNASHDDILIAYQSARIFALHTQEESQGIVFAEAMATGLPVVSTTVGGVPYVVENSVSGLLTPYADVHAMATSMVNLLSDDSLWCEMSKKAKERSKHYSWSDIAEAILSIYHGS